MNVLNDVLNDVPLYVDSWALRFAMSLAAARFLIWFATVMDKWGRGDG